MNIIAVWGANGTGKSTVALAIAHQFTRKNKNVVLLSADRVSPMFSTYLPYTKFDRDMSLGAFLTNDITMERIADKIHAHPKNKNLAFMCMGERDSYQRYKGNWTISKLNSLVELLSEMTDIIVLDLTSNFMADNFTLWGLEKADKVISVSNPDNRSLAFFETYKILIDNEIRFDTTKHIPVLNRCVENEPYKKFMEEYNYEYYLPDSFEIKNNFNCSYGNIFKGNDKNTKTFHKTIKNIVRKELSFE